MRKARRNARERERGTPANLGVRIWSSPFRGGEHRNHLPKNAIRVGGLTMFKKLI